MKNRDNVLFVPMAKGILQECYHLPSGPVVLAPSLSVDWQCSQQCNFFYEFIIFDEFSLRTLTIQDKLETLTMLSAWFWLASFSYAEALLGVCCLPESCIVKVLRLNSPLKMKFILFDEFGLKWGWSLTVLTIRLIYLFLISLSFQSKP